MRALIVIALISAIVGLFGGLVIHMLMIAGRQNVVVYQMTGPIITRCHGVPLILLSVVLLNRKDAP